MSQINLLLVDDHPITIDGYKNIISNHEHGSALINFTTAYSCHEAYEKILNAHNLCKPFEVAFLDISLPPYEAKQLHSGIDLGILIRNHFPTCKIILLTMHHEPVLVNKAIQKIKPEGFILKNDVNASSFIKAYQSVIIGNSFYSPTISKAQNNALVKKLNFDAIDCQILELISKNIKTKDMTQHIDLSLSAIEKRKAAIKNKLLKDKGSDKEIVVQAKKMGLL
ncbi:response regulator [Flavobacterium granuli]|uniref:DNA-binding NarL/FixJ family response regulator n=1 Tax=Flavobacterium granuli TaxID=280093 RepID=A0A1M5U2F9_9FLAO|nr:response regulator transcription factor [Flavobacterium granuli]PRZ19593.1 DNA-binding NarL/FixJ family response regulator [Flavobacterium granuli]SHH57158.1 DNA-binding response regulator, NarL/FixJ family, contains REC and HTH domains [Flavobacterium granuli]